MPLLGRYKAENNDDVLSYFSIIIDVKETEKSYIFSLVELDSHYSAHHMKSFFEKSKRVVLGKKRGGHAVRIWSDADFTFYPYQAGFPYYFVKQQPPSTDLD